MNKQPRRTPVIFALYAALGLAVSWAGIVQPPGFGPGARFHLEHSKDGLGVRSHGIKSSAA